ncbi:hypothetical protein OG921_04860 [Aldersonia sp. NBC_00410]|uniref:hypothetical protein n=1 Tax=Aldersonia sp. NBC_00410 TaxID=2975954 RepID=UPI0022515E93|nr:hypothetical protein [Aldersonia sp. NBC_00410]MCX5042502.1 hypothetical protein [Aldersonia sp. NBC_00410]
MAARSTRPRLALALAITATAVIAAGCGDAGDTQNTDAATQVEAAAPDITAAPAGLRWEPYQGIALPFSNTDGPASTTGGAVGGFGHTPQGAALAAIQQSTRIGVAPDAQWAAVLAAGAAPGAERDSFAVNRMQVSITAPVVAAEAPTIRGYRIGDYTPERAMVTVFTSFPDTSRAATDVAVVWSDGDWRLMLPAGDSAAAVRSVDTIPSDRFVALEAP